MTWLPNWVTVPSLNSAPGQGAAEARGPSSLALPQNHGAVRAGELPPATALQRPPELREISVLCASPTNRTKKKHPAPNSPI